MRKKKIIQESKYRWADGSQPANIEDSAASSKMTINNNMNKNKPGRSANEITKNTATRSATIGKIKIVKHGENGIIQKISASTKWPSPKKAANKQTVER